MGRWLDHVLKCSWKALFRFLMFYKRDSSYKTFHIILQTHEQAVDPNLVRLAEAYKVAATEMQSKKAYGGTEELNHRGTSLQVLETVDDDVHV